MAIFGTMKGKPGAPKNPREVAQAILDKLDPASSTMISGTSYAPHSSSNACAAEKCIAYPFSEAYYVGYTVSAEQSCWLQKLVYVNNERAIVCASSCLGALKVFNLLNLLLSPGGRHGCLILFSEQRCIACCRLAGPGFINIKIERDWLAEHIRGVLLNSPASIVPTVNKRVVVDFSSPNVAKEMHVGHLRYATPDSQSHAIHACNDSQYMFS